MRRPSTRELNQAQDILTRERFWSKVNLKGPKYRTLGRCWVWIGSTGDKGHGRFHYRGRNIPAHHFPLISEGLIIPSEKLVCHRCGNVSCVRKTHLYIGTHLTNQHDRVTHGTLLTGEDHPQARLTEEDVQAIRLRYAAGEISRTLAEFFGVSRGNVDQIVQGRTWTHVGGPIGSRGKHRGERSPAAKLTDVQVIDIRQHYSVGNTSYRKLAAIYKVSTSTIQRIIEKRSWTHVKPQRRK